MNAIATCEPARELRVAIRRPDCTASTGGLQCTRNDGRGFTLSKGDIALK